MSLNQCMHPRNIYRNNPPDFLELSELYPEFKPFVKVGKSGKPFVNFKNASTVRTLAKCLLHKDFQLKVTLPSNRLAPTVPSRLNYLLWIQDLLNATDSKNPLRHIIDIGTGSSCVYPLLGVKIDPNWHFIATDIDDINYENALHNVEANSFADRIRVMRVLPECSTLLKHLLEGNSAVYDCCMCNPPFFCGYEQSQRKLTRPAANSACSAGEVEAVANGGDFSFAKRLLAESVEWKERLMWFTIMLGKKSSFTGLKDLLKRKGESLFWTTYEFCQGNTVRWGIAWTFCPELVNKSKVPKSQLKLAARKAKFHRPIVFIVTDPCSLETACESIKETLDKLSVMTSVSTSKSFVTDEILIQASAKEATWLHVRHRTRKRLHNGSQSADTATKCTALEIEPPLDFNIKLSHDDTCRVKLEFTATDPNQKETLNGLVVYLKRVLSKPLLRPV